MAKSLVEKYEQILSQDPASTVFVELAKALIEQGDHPRAVTVCETGLGHHPKSVVGRVLWGKALINLGRPAEAMEQFDRAIAIDKENPHAYNLIGEVLLHKGLYRSALPLLRKAVALQPNDGRVRQWLEQTKTALAGGPAPILSEPAKPDPAASETPAEGSAALPSGGGGALGDDEEGRDRTDVMQAYVPEVQRASGAPATTLELPAYEKAKDGARAAPASFAEHVTDPGLGALGLGEDDAPPTTVGGAPLNLNEPAQLPFDPEPAAPPRELVTDPGEAPEPRTPTDGVAPPAGAGDDPFDNVPKRTSSKETIRGLTSTFDALADGGGAPVPAPAAAPVTSSRRRTPEPSVVPSAALTAEAPEEDSGLLGDIPLPSGVQPAPVAARQEPVRVKSQGPGPAHGSRGGGLGLLDDIPDAAEPTSSVDLPKVELSSQATEAIAQEYERELREKLAKASAQKTFLQRNGLKLAISSTLVVALLVGAGVFIRTRASNQGRDLKDALADAKRGILLDTPQSYRFALEALEQAVRMSPKNTEAWALKAYAHSVMFSDEGGPAEQRQKALEALAREGVKDEFSHLATAADYLLAEGREKDAARGTILGSTSDRTELLELAGRILLSQNKPEGAVAKLKAALQAEPRNVRAMVALGAYFREAEDYQQALELYDAAMQISASHPEAVIGTAESRIKLRQDLEQSMAAITALPVEGLNPDLHARKVLVEGKVLSLNGKHAEAVAKLAEGQKSFRGNIFDFNVALGEAQAAAGQMESAQRSFEAAFKLRPKSEQAKEALGRILIARDRGREVLQKIQPESGERRVHLVRGLAAAQSGDWKLARAELQRTQVNNKLPAEAAIWLALADAADGDLKRATEVLEKALAATRKNKAEVQVALGKVYLQSKALDKARAQFEAASKSPDDVEGSCQLGLLLMKLGLPELAVAPLTQAVERNASHLEARHALVQALVHLGRHEDAFKSAEAGYEDNPGSPIANKDLALAAFRSSKMKEAEEAAARAVSAGGSDFELFRVRAQILFARGDGKDAFKSLERANKLNPKDAETFCEIGFALLRQGHPDYALQAFDAARRENGEAPCAGFGPVIARMGVAKTSARELDGVLQKSTAAHDRALALTALARVQLSSGATAKAKKSIDEAVKLAPYSGFAHHMLAQVQFRLKDDGARASLEKAAELEPVWSAVRLQLADLLADGSEADQQKAVAEYEAFLRAGGSPADVARVNKLLPTLKKKLATR